MVKSIVGCFFSGVYLFYFLFRKSKEFWGYVISAISLLSLCAVRSMVLLGLVKFLLAELQLLKYSSHKKYKLSK